MKRGRRDEYQKTIQKRNVEEDDQDPVQAVRPVSPDLMYKDKGTMEVPIRYRRHLTQDGKMRVYFVGRAKIAIMHVYPEGKMRSGNVCLHMNCILDNGGKWFDSLKEAIKYLHGALTGDPNPDAEGILESIGGP